MSVRFVPLVLTLFVAGCGPRTEVAKDRVLAQVDQLLGEVGVKQKEAEQAIRSLDAQFDTLKKAKIEGRVRLAQVTEQLADVETRTERADYALKRLRGYLEKGRDVEINGRTFSTVALKELADRTISARRLLASEGEALRSSERSLALLVSTLDQREREGRERLRTLRQNLDDIAAKAMVLKSLQHASDIAGVLDWSQFKQIEQQIRELAVKVDTELAFQDEKWQEIDADDQSLEAILRETSTTSDTISEIDEILGQE